MAKDLTTALVDLIARADADRDVLDLGGITHSAMTFQDGRPRVRVAVAYGVAADDLGEILEEADVPEEGARDRIALALPREDVERLANVIDDVADTFQDAGDIDAANQAWRVERAIRALLGE